VSIDGSASSRLVYVFDSRSGLWSCKAEAFYRLVHTHRWAVGAQYGSMLPRFKSLHTLAGMFHEKSTAWTQQLNLLAPGLVPFSDGIYNVLTGVLRPFEPDDMLTVKFEHAAPRDDERYAAEEDEVRKTLEQMMPEKRLSRLRRWMLPCSAPSTPSRCRRRSCRTAWIRRSRRRMTFNRRPTEKEGRARVTLAAASVGAESVSLFPTTSSGSCGSRRAGGGGEQRAAPRHRPGARERLRGG